ncbi:2Fe-2S iron-sulfur cluster binding domain-containing protein [Heliorestis acidaminivorans]|uniref:2Fe-2S iron-sulfur cluster binding domain-containing protein n=1 Tax=Heliorestis acidaminivorans TaxID=553427 RepID=A0A6I0EV61_9FIRM|nr:NADH-dependent [FeFe] hydrogenase, group A6 [Heliorestis acidaminivorans]KAB2953354.1 2Fe-2S iron-sulfur cluster binding domain-containing protein [Heliorestis acidaminivorans]
MNKVNLTIDGRQVTVSADSTVLEAARKLKIKIPTLCYLKDINAIGACRMCLVEVKGARSLQASCVLPVEEGMEIKTNSPLVRTTRRTVLELILSNHNRECTLCVRNSHCELQTLAMEIGVREISFPGELPERPVDQQSPALLRDGSKCILCRRCVALCHQVQSVGVIQATERGFQTTIEPVFGKSLNEVACIFCGQCIHACPVAALQEKDERDKVWKALADPDLHVLVQTAPAVRVALGEEFGLGEGRNVTGKMVAALRQLAFDRIFDTNLSADLTIVEESHELMERVNQGGPFPLITSCSPAWVKYVEHHYPQLLSHLSTCKSPQQMMGALLKTYYAQIANIDPAKIFVVSIMPCTAKKFECQRPEMRASGFQDVDVVLTTRELGQMIRQAGIDFPNLTEEDFDEPFGESTGAAMIFGVTGGVAESALRTVADLLTGSTVEKFEYEEVRGLEGIKESTVQIGEQRFRLAVANGIGQAKKLLEQIVKGEKQYHFIEVMACPGGCIGGGGQPICKERIEKEKTDFPIERLKALYKADKGSTWRKSHENPTIKELYNKFFEKPNSKKAHELLHTAYMKRPLTPKE